MRSCCGRSSSGRPAAAAPAPPPSGGGGAPLPLPSGLPAHEAPQKRGVGDAVGLDRGEVGEQPRQGHAVRVVLVLHPDGRLGHDHLLVRGVALREAHGRPQRVQRVLRTMEGFGGGGRVVRAGAREWALWLCGGGGDLPPS